MNKLARIGLAVVGTAWIILLTLSVIMFYALGEKTGDFWSLMAQWLFGVPFFIVAACAALGLVGLAVYALWTWAFDGE